MFLFRLFAHHKGMGSTKNGRDSNAKRLGPKRADGQEVLAGNILVTERNENPSRQQCRYRKRRHFVRFGRRSRQIRKARQRQKTGQRLRSRIIQQRKQALNEVCFFFCAFYSEFGHNG